MKEYYNKYINEENKFDTKTMIAIIALIIVFSGIFGFIYEYIFYFFNGGMKEFYWRGGNFLPWINIYAIGALIIYLLTFRFRKSALKVFFIGGISCGILELISGFGIYTILDQTRYWDYNKEILNFLNIGGFICLRSVLFFAVSSLILIYIIVPFIYYLAKKMNRKLFIILSIVICSIFLFDEIYNLVISKVLLLPRAIDVYKSMGIKFVTFK